MGNACVADNFLNTKEATVSEYGRCSRGSNLAPLEQLEIVLFPVREIDCQDLCILLVDDELRFDRVPLLLPGIVVFLAVFTVFCLFFSVAQSGSRTRRRG